MIIGATGESDKDIMYSATHFYKNYNMKRVYYSGYVPISTDSRLPSLGSEVPMLRENRLYQTDWLLRFYGFSVNEILDADNPNLEMDIDPKLMWALRNLIYFPIDINKADSRMLARIPGIGLGSVHKIINGRKYRNLSWDHLKKMGVALNRAKYFIICNSNDWERRDLDAAKIKGMILQSQNSKFKNNYINQLSLFN
jgi:predicted DNA-binding helix-hairpin-helix protein